MLHIYTPQSLSAKFVMGRGGELGMSSTFTTIWRQGICFGNKTNSKNQPTKPKQNQTKRQKMCELWSTLVNGE